MKRFLLLSIIMFVFIGNVWSQSISVNDPADPESGFTPEQLIEEVLIGGNDCGDLEFIFLQENCEEPMTLANRSWGYFDAAGTNFPFEEGIILSTGFADSAEGPNDSTGISDSGLCPSGTWPGDNDLKIILDNQSGDNQPTNNATVFQFTFVPVVSDISFDFIFASEEYEDQFECSSQFRDGFAFLLRGPGVPDDSGTPFGGTNIAAVPGSSGVPVSTLSIHSDTFTCGPEIPGVNFFPELYVSNSGANNMNEIQFDGYTESISAQASLTPGETYELKMVIADRGDTAFDSAVFFRAGSFNIGVNLPPDMTISGGNAPCEGEPLEITVPVDPMGTTTYRWFVLDPMTMMFNVIPGETSNSLTVTTSGTYQIEASIDGGCVATDEIVIEFAPQPIAAEPDTLAVCDELPNDGFAVFDLTQRDAQIQNGQMTTTVIYYETFNNALNDMSPIPDPTMYTNIVQGFQTIYARLQENSFDCFDIVSLDLQVNDSPPITDPITDLIVCDNDQDGVEAFDLTSKEDEIGNTLVNITFTYHTSLADAEAGTPFIGTPMAYVSGGETVWVRAENIAGCFTVGTFDLVVDLVPEYVEVPEFIRCDLNDDGVESFNLNSQNAAIVDGDPDLSVTYHATEQDAMDATGFLPIPYTSSGEVVWVRVESNSRGCYGVFAMELVVVPAPEIFEPDPLVYCDDDNDGFGTFTLTDADDQVVNGNPAGNLVVSYHELLVHAQNGTLPLASPYDNIVPFSQTVYVRLFDIATGCYNITTLELVVEETPQISEPDALEACDTDGDGVFVFDLTDSEPQILAGLTGGPYVVNYYEDPGLTVAIGNPTSYPNISNPQIIFVTVGDTNNTCVAQTELELIVNFPPSLNEPAPYSLCDVNDPGDETEVFDLTSRIDEITGGDPTVTVTFYESFADAQAGTNFIANPSAYTNTENPQDIYIRGESSADCEAVGEPNGLVLELRVENLPAVAEPTPLEACDPDNDGFTEFVLTDKDAEIANGEPNLTITYHETLTDAQSGDFPLAVPYTNIVAGMQTVYARAVFSTGPAANGCVTVVELGLIVLPAPEIPLEIAPLVACAEGGMTAQFDLTEREAEVLDGLSPQNFTVSYYVQQADAIAGNNNTIATPTSYTNISNPQTIYVRVNNNTSICSDVGEFDLEVRDLPMAAQPEAFVKCDDLGEPFDGFTEFDLTEKDAEIAGAPSPGIIVSYYRTAQEAQEGSNAIDPATAYVNEGNPQTVYVRVDDLEGGCHNLTTLTLRVVNNPVPSVPDALVKCDTDPLDGMEFFDLTVAGAQAIGTNNWDVSYHLTLGEAVEGVSAIPNPGNFENTTSPQTVYIRVTNPLSQNLCFEIVEVELIVNPLPDASSEVSDMEACQVPFTGQAEFDLTEREGEILGSQDPALFVVTYYESLADATVPTNAIADPTSYTNLNNNPQDIYVGIENIETGCYVTMQVFQVEVLEGAIANAPAEPYAICDNTDPNDGIAEFTLEDADPASQAQLLRAEILAGNEPIGNFTLTYHETLSGAEAGTDPLGTVYTNLVNPQVIYARVDNDADGNGCFSVTEVILKVEQLPVLALEEEYRLCVDAQGLPLEAEFGGPSPPVLDTGLSPEDYTFTWELDGTALVGEVGPSLLAVQAGVYTVTVTERVTGCMESYMATVVESSPPESYDVDLVSGAFAGTHTIEASAMGGGEYHFQLDDGPFQDSGTFTNVSPGNHTVTIQDKNGCGSVVVEVGVVDYPRFVTPNQDGWNDTWNIIGIANADPSAKIYIFDRHGKLLKQVSPLGEGWDGTYNGNPLPSNDYWFLVEYKEDETLKEFRGHFTLKR
jgi:large repetitive protein